MSAFSPAVLGRLLAITVPAATVRRPCGAPGFHWLSPPAHRIHRLHSSKRTEATTITRYSYAPHALPAPVARASQTEPRFDRPHHCPACGQACYRPSVLHRHLQRCCPDLFRDNPMPPLSGDQLVTDRWLGAARSAEELQRQRALELTFKQRDASNTPVRRSADQVAEILGVGVDRAERLVKAAMRAVPMPADPDPVDVIFEDDDVVAVNKPAGIITAPKHRYVGGSMFNRVIHYLGGVEPAVVHRLDMNTTGVLLFAKSRDVVPALHKQFREKAARKEYLALVSGVPLWTELEVIAAIGRHKDIEVARQLCPDGKPASTRCKVMASFPLADLSNSKLGAAIAVDTAHQQKRKGAALVACWPATGRTHQIRLHLAHTGHSILGDDRICVTLDDQAGLACGKFEPHTSTNRGRFGCKCTATG